MERPRISRSFREGPPERPQDLKTLVLEETVKVIMKSGRGRGEGSKEEIVEVMMTSGRGRGERSEARGIMNY